MKAQFVYHFCCLLIAAIALAPQSAYSLKFSKKEIKQLGEGKTVRRQNPLEDNGLRLSGNGWAYVNAPVSVVWKAIQDWPSYTRCYTNTIETTEISRKGNRSLVRMRLGHPIIQVIYHLQMTKMPGDKVLRFKMVTNHPSDMEDIDGYWQLIPVGENKTLVGYIISVKAPSGIVSMLPESFKRMTINGILGIPGQLKRCVEKDKTPGKSYSKSSSKTTAKK